MSYVRDAIYSAYISTYLLYNGYNNNAESLHLNVDKTESRTPNTMSGHFNSYMQFILRQDCVVFCRIST
jgi:23S rRNA maturation mini-RNase III